MTPIERPFEEEWPALANLLRSTLTRRGFASHHVDDVVQETGLRLFSIWDRVDSDRSVRGLTFTIANNVLWEESKSSGCHELMETVPDVPAPHDAEQAGIARLELRKVKHALCELSDPQRAVLLAEVGSATPPVRSPDAIKMLRMRARRRLSAILKQASAFAAVVVGDVKRLMWRVASVLSRRENALVFEGQAATLAAMCGAVAMAIVTAGVILPSRSSDPLTAEEASERLPSARVAPGSRFDAQASSASPDRSAGAATTRAPVGVGERHGEDPDYEVTVGEDGPVRGRATVESSPDEDGGHIDPPTCSADQSGEQEVTVSCRIDTGDEEITVGAEVEVRP